MTTPIHFVPRPLGRFAAGAWVGVELKSENGKNNGSVQVIRSRLSSLSRAWAHRRVSASHPSAAHTHMHRRVARRPHSHTHTHTRTAEPVHVVRVHRPGGGSPSASDSRRDGAVERKKPTRNPYAPATSSVDIYKVYTLYTLYIYISCMAFDISMDRAFHTSSARRGTAFSCGPSWCSLVQPARRRRRAG